MDASPFCEVQPMGGCGRRPAREEREVKAFGPPVLPRVATVLAAATF